METTIIGYILGLYLAKGSRAVYRGDSYQPKACSMMAMHRTSALIGARRADAGAIQYSVVSLSVQRAIFSIWT